MLRRVTQPDGSTIITREYENQDLDESFLFFARNEIDRRHGMHPIIARLVFLPTYAWNLLLGRVLHRRNWWDNVEQNVILGARPLRQDVPKLSACGVRAVVNMCQEFRGPIDLYEKFQIEQLWLPTIDFQPPSLAHVQQGVEFIQQFVEKGESVYVHCKAGRARSATVVLCWMVKYRKMTIAQAQAKLLECRRHVSPDLDQRAVVVEFAKRLARSE